MISKKHPAIIKLKDRNYFDTLEQELSKHGNVKVTGHGVFKLKKVKARKIYNVGLGKYGMVMPQTKIVFHPSKAFKEAVQKYGDKKD